jgi:membrane associated rhomboid family serine protease
VFFILPYKSSVKGPIIPWVNYIFIGILILIFVWIHYFSGEKYINRFILNKWSAFSLLGYMWIHISLTHLLLNVIYLWVFGNALCSKVGNLLYFILYLVGGLIAASGYMVFDGRPCVGASGAINVVIVALCMLFPYREIRGYLLFTIIPISRFSIMGIWYLLIKFLFELFFSLIGLGKVAFIIHVSGIVGGGVLVYFLIKMKILRPENTSKDLVQSIYSSMK